MEVGTTVAAEAPVVENLNGVEGGNVGVDGTEAGGVGVIMDGVENETLRSLAKETWRLISGLLF